MGPVVFPRRKNETGRVLESPGQRAENTQREQEIRQLRTQLAEVEAERDRWRGRAERMRGSAEQLQQENDRLTRDLSRLADALAELAAHPVIIQPPPPPLPAPLDIPAILDQFRRTIQPDIHIHERPDAPDEQRAGINWSHQGLDNTAGTPENVRDPFDPADLTPPDYVLDIESLSPSDVKGSRGGWYNPQT